MEKEFIISHNKGDLRLGKSTKVMGIVNLTPDSFSNNGFSYNISKAIEYAVNLVKDGADIIDIGGESSRPGALPVSEDEELRRIIPFVKELSKAIDKPISIDTYKSKVAIKAIEAGAQMINDISALNAEKEMLKIVAEYNVPVVLMHMKGEPQNMQLKAYYNDVVFEIIDFFQEVINRAINNGIDRNKIIIDPGIGFGKNWEHNIEILKRLREFKVLDCPVLIGTSRKSFIGKILNKPIGDRLIGSLATAAVAIMNGVDIVRVHDVKETTDITKVCDAIMHVN